MQTLAQVAQNPSGWDSVENYMGTPLSKFAALYVVMTRTRDSSFLTQHNWEIALEILEGESENVVIHRFGHWACGWWEALCVTAERKATGEAIQQKLENYPILNEDRFCEAEWEKALENWCGLSMKERVQLCQEAHVSPFAARRNYIPDADTGYIYDSCRPE